MLSKVIYEHSPLPVPGSKQAEEVGTVLYDNFLDWKDRSSELRTKIWPACDRGFLGIRTLPRAPGFHWVDRGDQGETDLWDAVRLIVEGILLSLMPRNMSWLEVTPLEAEEQGISNTFRDYLIQKHADGGCRDNWGKHITQLLVRGTSAIGWEWHQAYRAKKRSLAERLATAIGPQLDVAREQLGELFNVSPDSLDPVDLLPPDLFQPFEQDREMELQFDGPIIRCLDMQDVFLDPNCNATHDLDVPMAILQYKTFEELTGTVDSNNQPLYSNLEDLTAHTLDQIWNETQRGDSAKYLGLNSAPSGARGAKYVPVLVFHRQMQVVGNDKWLDTYFHVAISQSGGPRLIRSEVNPLRSGRRTVYIDTYHEHYNGCAYGISAIEKSLPAYHQKCVLASLTLNAQVASVFPAYNVVANVTVDDRRPVVAPGSYNFVTYRPNLGPNFIAPVPTPNSGALLGMQAQQFLGQKILGQTGAVGGALGLDPSRNIEQSKTATQIDTESASSSIGRDNLLEKLSKRSLEPMCQGIAEGAAQYAQGDLIQFVYDVGGEPALMELQKLDLGRRRKITVTGYTGLQQKQKEVQDYTKALQVIGQGNGMQYLGAGGPLMLREIMLKLLGRYGVKDIDKYRLPDLELIQQTPGGQQFLQQFKLQTVQEVLQAVGVDPQLAQNVLQLFGQQAQQEQQAA